MLNLKKVLYLTMDDVKAIGFSDEDFINCVSDIFVQYGQGQAQPLPKLGTKISPSKSFHVASGWVKKSKTSGVKWASSFATKSNGGLNPNAGVIILNDTTYGLPKAIMDAFYISVKCTAASYAVFASFYAKKDADVLSLLGVSHQALHNVRAIRLILNQLREIRIYDANLGEAKRFAQSVEDEFHGSVIVCSTVEEALENTNVVLATEMIPKKQLTRIADKWLPRAGVFIATTGLARFEGETISRMDKIIVDGLRHSAILGNAPVYADQGEVSVGSKCGRESAHENIIIINNGLVVQEIYIGSKMYDSAKEKGIGLELAPITW